MNEANLTTSIDLWTNGKVIGRECSQLNLDYLWCKKEKGLHPDACKKQGQLAMACADNIVKISREKFPEEFEAHKACLDYNDFRTYECRQTEDKFHACWNKLNGAI